VLLTEQSESFSDQYDPESIFWSRYYWFLRFVHVVQGRQGADAGLEQQAFQILEHPWPDCEPDWNNLEAVERSAKEAATADRRSPTG
jgi:hypothetical protein